MNYKWHPELDPQQVQLQSVGQSAFVHVQTSISRHQKYERRPEDGMVVRETVSMIRDLVISPLWPRYPRLWHTMAGHRHTSHRVTRHTWHRTLGLRSRGDQWPHTVHTPDLCDCRCDAEHHDPFALFFSPHISSDFPHSLMTCTWCNAVSLLQQRTVWNEETSQVSHITKVGSRHK